MWNCVWFFATECVFCRCLQAWYIHFPSAFKGLILFLTLVFTVPLYRVIFLFYQVSSFKISVLFAGLGFIVFTFAPVHYKGISPFRFVANEINLIFGLHKLLILYYFWALLNISNFSFFKEIILFIAKVSIQF